MSAPRSSKALGFGLLIAAFIIAGVLSYFASSQPDGLERVAEDTGISASEGNHATADGPLADYQMKGIEQPWLSGGLAGVIGVVAVGAAATGLFMILRPRRNDQPQPSVERSDDHAALRS